MRYFLILIVLMTFFFVFQINLQKIDLSRINPQKILISIDKSVSIRLPPDIKMDGLQINYFITGAFGGVGSFIRIEPNIRNYEIPTTYDGKPVVKLQMIVFSPHYLVKTFDFPNLEGQNKNIELKLEPSETTPFSGKVLLPDHLNADELEVKVGYLARWKCEYFGLSDCLLAPMPIASARLERDGRFKVNLPDFARDPTIASYKKKGNFSFRLERKKNNQLFWLKLNDDSKIPDEVPAASIYLTEQFFVIRPDK